MPENSFETMFKQIAVMKASLELLEENCVEIEVFGLKAFLILPEGLKKLDNNKTYLVIDMDGEEMEK